MQFWKHRYLIVSDRKMVDTPLFRHHHLYLLSSQKSYILSNKHDKTVFYTWLNSQTSRGQWHQMQKLVCHAVSVPLFRHVRAGIWLWERAEWHLRQHYLIVFRPTVQQQQNPHQNPSARGVGGRDQHVAQRQAFADCAEPVTGPVQSRGVFHKEREPVPLGSRQ